MFVCEYDNQSAKTLSDWTFCVCVLVQIYSINTLHLNKYYNEIRASIRQRL